MFRAVIRPFLTFPNSVVTLREGILLRRALKVLTESQSLWHSLAYFLDWALTIYMWVVIVRAVISWVNPSPYNPVVQFLARVTDPVLLYIRRKIPTYAGGIDFSPVILILLVSFLQLFLVSLLVGLPRNMPGWNFLQGIANDMPLFGAVPIFIISIIRLVQSLLYAFMIIVIIRAVLSWISPDPYNMIVRFIYGVTEPVLQRIRGWIPLVIGGIDLSPMLLILAIYFLNPLLNRLMIIVVQAFR